MNSPADPLEEYKDASANMRHYSNLRFAQLTIFVAVTGGLIAILIKDKGIGEAPAKLMIKVMGIFMVFVFWIMEERIIRYWETHRRRAEELEDQLRYLQYKTRPKGKLIRGRTAARLLFGGIIIFWTVALIWHESF